MKAETMKEKLETSFDMSNYSCFKHCVDHIRDLEAAGHMVYVTEGQKIAYVTECPLDMLNDAFRRRKLRESSNQNDCSTVKLPLKVEKLFMSNYGCFEDCVLDIFATEGHGNLAVVYGDEGIVYDSGSYGNDSLDGLRDAFTALGVRGSVKCVHYGCPSKKGWITIDPPEHSRKYIFNSGRQITVNGVNKLLMGSNVHKLETVSGQKFIINNDWCSIELDTDDWAT